VMNTASQNSINRLTTAGKVCSRDSTNAKLELAGAIFAAIAVSGFAYFLKIKPPKKSPRRRRMHES
jgi:hypothetical protein